MTTGQLHSLPPNGGALPGRPPPGGLWSLPFPLALFIVAAALRLLSFAVFYVGSVLLGHHGVVDPYDPVGYDAWGWFIAQNLHAGRWVNIESTTLAGTYDVGFQYLVGIIYFLFGRHPELVRVIEAVLAGFVAPAVYVAARAGNAGEQVAQRAGWLMAVWPLTLYWAGYDMLRDQVIWFLIAIALVAIASPRRWVFVALGALSASLMMLFRGYVGIGLILLLPIAALMRRDWRAATAVAGVLVAVEVGFATFHVHPPAWDIRPYLGHEPVIATKAAPDFGPAKTDPTGSVGPGTTTGAKAVPGSFRAIIDPNGGEEPGANISQLVQHPGPRSLGRVALGFATTLLGPRLNAHDIVHPTLDSGMFPGLIPWLLLLPFTALGFWRGFRTRDPRLLAYGLFSIGLWLLLGLGLGAAFRQREMAFPSTLIFTSLGLQRPWTRRWLITYGAILIAGFGILVLRETGII